MATADLHSPSLNITSTLTLPVKKAIRFLELIRACNRLAADYERMSHMSDARLARDGLSRDAIPGEIARRAAHC